jgi:hypothetical protein
MVSSFLSHPGYSKLYCTLKEIVYWRNMKRDVQEFTNGCSICQKYKISKEFESGFDTSEQKNRPFEHIGIDTVGPLPISRDGQGVEYRHVLTIIDYCTRLVELCPLSNLNSIEVASKFDEIWLCRYPRPLRVTADGAFNNSRFKELLESYGIKAQFSTPHNPQSNGVVERMHYTLNNSLRCSETSNWHEKLSAISWSIRTSYHQSISATPGDLVFGMNMLHLKKYKREKKLMKH